jgi:hypothetical protein
MTMAPTISAVFTTMYVTCDSAIDAQGFVGLRKRNPPSACVYSGSKDADHQRKGHFHVAIPSRSQGGAGKTRSWPVQFQITHKTFVTNGTRNVHRTDAARRIGVG